MKKDFKLSIALDNDAFAEYPVLEIAYILEKLVQKLRSDTTTENYSFYQNLLDCNGNMVGTYAIKPAVIPEPVKRKARKQSGLAY